MSTSHVAVFDTTLDKTHRWLRELVLQCGLRNHSQAYSVLREILHALRDHLIADEAVNLGAQLPMLIRGFYYEGWKPSSTPIEQRTKQAFLDDIKQALSPIESVDPEAAVRAVFDLLNQHVSHGEIEDVRQMLPKEIRDLWPAPAKT